MKKIFVTGGFALLSFGLFAALSNGSSSYVHEDYSSICNQNFQDTTQKKKDKKGKKDKKKDSTTVAAALTSSQLVVR
jgi:hypothetical protein